MMARQGVGSIPAYFPKGYALIIVTFVLLLISALSIGTLTVASGIRQEAVAVKARTSASLAAEAASEKAVFWMSRQPDMLNALKDKVPGINDTVSLPDGKGTYQIGIYTFIGSRPVYRIQAGGQSGIFRTRIESFVIQAVGGWDMAMCRVPESATSTAPVYFTTGETIDMPLHINKYNDYPDTRDIHVSGSPAFLSATTLCESRYADNGVDKYFDIMGSFPQGIFFDQPASKINDEATVQEKVDRFQDSTLPQYCFKPKHTASVSYAMGAVQLEFWVQGNQGMITITEDCTIRGARPSSSTRDWKIKPKSDPLRFETYDIYAYHVIEKNARGKGLRYDVPVTETYVTQSFGGYESEPGGQIFVDGHVIIGGNLPYAMNNQTVKGKITVVATGNIWVGDSIYIDGHHEPPIKGEPGKPSLDNPNTLGLIAQGVIKVVDPGLSAIDGNIRLSRHDYEPVGIPDESRRANPYDRHLEEYTVIEATIIVGGGGWGAENVRYGWSGGRKECTHPWDYLVVHGTITEVVRGVVGLIDEDGYLKSYHMDERFLEGILPGDLWLRGKFIPAPAGWQNTPLQ